MPEKKFTIHLSVDNIGPHNGINKIDFTNDVDSNKAVFFATNGTGKSFISRTFRLFEPDKCIVTADELLTLGQSNGTLSFAIIDGHVERKLSIAVTKGQLPTINDGLGLKFHVFNSDYVEDNIKPQHYTPNGNIEGYILGKVQIDLSDEKTKEDAIKKQKDAIDSEINTKIEDARKELRDIGVAANTTELSLISRSSIIENRNFADVPDYVTLIKQLETLREVPEGIEDIAMPKFDLNIDFLDKVTEVLKTEYPKSDWDKDFVAEYKEKKAFIEEGLDLSKEDGHCPFCKQRFGDDALSLINQYNAYRQDKESALLSELKSYVQSIKALISALNNCQTTLAGLIGRVDLIQKYFPSLSYIKLTNIEIPKDIMDSFVCIQNVLEDKMFDFSKSITCPNEINLCKLYINTTEKIIKNNESQIIVVNNTKNNSNNERLSLRRKLCKAKYKTCVETVLPLLQQYNKLSEELIDIHTIILDKEQKMRVSKRDKVYESLTFFLNLFFEGKYTIDRDTFQIRFLGTNIGDKASSILSDGEKSIVAYCHYLAMTHILIEQEEDYNKLFFIIDDPISSMDFHYVYAVAQSIRNIKTIFNISTHERIWVFTHNMEFLSILARNYILNTKYIIKQGMIRELDHRLLLPYESHLKDLVEISKGLQTPSHTTANSIRHVIETVCRFEYPEKSIESYISENGLLSENACIFTLCQDLSHGGIRNQPPFSEDVLTAASKVVVDFMRQKYEGQIAAIEGNQ